ncbi:MAG: sulfurtransferase TusA family protein [Asgard group archaeon]|nr:sulfurtransferase TusA family protein [Asgard group archaeon]
MNSEANELIHVDCMGLNCPMPLVNTRKAIRKADPGDIIEIVGDHEASKEEIPMAVEALGLELLGVTEKENVWTIKIKIPEDYKE